MTQRQFNLWFVLSTIWMVAIFIVAFIPNGVSMFGEKAFNISTVVCAINLIGCLVIGSYPSKD